MPKKKVKQKETKIPFSKKRKLLKGTALAFLILALLITFYLILGGIQLDPLLKEYGLVGLFIAAIISNATLFLVVPLDIVVLGLGKIFHPLLLGAVIGMGAALGELTAYIAGLGGRKALEQFNSEDDSRLEIVRGYVELYGMPFILIGALTPFPFDLVGIACGLVRFNIFKFFIAAFVGKFFRYTLLAYAGLLGIALLKNFFLIG